MRIYKLWFIENYSTVFMEECECVEKDKTYLVSDSWYVKKEDLDKLNATWNYMYSLNNTEATVNLFKKLLRDKYTTELKKIQDKISSLNNSSLSKF